MSGLVFACIAPHGSMTIPVLAGENGQIEGTDFRGELLSYEVPTYFGMMCVAYESR